MKWAQGTYITVVANTREIEAIRQRGVSLRLKCP